jgi:hypothetical protein
MPGPLTGENTSFIFKVRSKADVAMDEIYLDESGYHHLVMGHRDLRSVIQLGVQATVAAPTQVYTSKTSLTRLIFASENVTTKGGRPMGVVVERENAHGRVVTATPMNDRTYGRLVWESASALQSMYDSQNDLLYLSTATADEAFAEESDDPHLWFRRSDDDERPIGATVFDLRSYWRDRTGALIKMVAGFLRVMEIEVQVRVEAGLRE